MGKRNENNVCHIQYKNYVNVNLTAVRSYFILLKREKKFKSYHLLPDCSLHDEVLIRRIFLSISTLTSNRTNTKKNPNMVFAFIFVCRKKISNWISFDDRNCDCSLKNSMYKR